MELKDLGVPELVSHMGVIDSYIHRIKMMDDSLQLVANFELIEKGDGIGVHNVLYERFKALDVLKDALTAEYDTRLSKISGLDFGINDVDNELEGFVQKHPELAYSYDRMEQTAKQKVIDEQNKEKDKRKNYKRKKKDPIKLNT